MATQNTHEIGPVDMLAADTIGNPGQRRFRLLIRNERAIACLWLEKEQLQALAVAVEQLVARIRGTHPMVGLAVSRQESLAAIDFPARADVEFRVGQLGLDYDQGEERIILMATASKEEGGPAESLRCQASMKQAEAFSKRALAICSAGRPRCPYCGAPLAGQPHACPGSNGHHRTRE